MATEQLKQRPIFVRVPNPLQPKQDARQYFKCPSCEDEVGKRDTFCRWCGVKFADLPSEVLEVIL